MATEVIGVKISVFREPLTTNVMYAFQINSALDTSKLASSEKSYKSSNGALFAAVSAAMRATKPKWRVDVVEFE